MAVVEAGSSPCGDTPLAVDGAQPVDVAPTGQPLGPADRLRARGGVLVADLSAVGMADDHPVPDAITLHQAGHRAPAAGQVGEVVAVHLTGHDAEVVLSQNGFDLAGVGAVVAGGAEDLPQVGPGATPDAAENEACGR